MARHCQPAHRSGFTLSYFFRNKIFGFSVRKRLPPRPPDCGDPDPADPGPLDGGGASEACPVGRRIKGCSDTAAPRLSSRRRASGERGAGRGEERGGGLAGRRRECLAGEERGNGRGERSAWPWGAGVELAREERKAGRRRRGAGRGERGRPPPGGLRRAGPLSRQVRGELRRPRWAGTRGGPGPAPRDRALKPGLRRWVGGPRGGVASDQGSPLSPAHFPRPAERAVLTRLRCVCSSLVSVRRLGSGR